MKKGISGPIALIRSPALAHRCAPSTAARAADGGAARRGEPAAAKRWSGAGAAPERPAGLPVALESRAWPAGVAAAGVCV